MSDVITPETEVHYKTNQIMNIYNKTKFKLWKLEYIFNLYTNWKWINHVFENKGIFEIDWE